MMRSRSELVDCCSFVFNHGPTDAIVILALVDSLLKLLEQLGHELAAPLTVVCSSFALGVGGKVAHDGHVVL